MIESPELRKVFLLLRKELRDSDIPHHTTIRTRVDEVLQEHLASLEKEMAVRELIFIQLVAY